LVAMEKRKKRLLTVKDVAAYLQVSQTTIYRLAWRGQIPAFKVGGDWRFNIESVDEWKLRAGSISIDRATNTPRLPISEKPDPTAALDRIYEAISRILGPLTELSRQLQFLERIADAIADKRDTADEIARLYEGETIPFRNYSENLLKFVPNPVGVIDRDGHLVSFNDSYCELFGFKRKQLRTARLTDLVHGDDLENFTAVQALLWQGNTEFARSAMRRLTASGEAIPVRSTAWPIRRTPAAKPKFLAATLDRIADQKEAADLFTRSADQLSERREEILKRR
jgi:excisionase family DNA binding protein/PAS domain S-box-containing protein